MGLWLLLACCLLKFVFIAVFVIPPWDVADEVGHLAFIKHLATGNGIPVLMETKVDEGMWNAIAGNTELPPGHNWIAQHPPLYYLIMIPSYWVGDFLGDSVEYPLFAGRVCNGFMMVLALFILYRMIKLYSDNDLLALSIVAMVASIPMVSQTAAGVTNDSLVLLLSVVLTWRWMCFYRTLSKRDLILVGLILGLCGITKYTLLPGIAAVSAFVVLYLIQQKQASTKLVVMFLC
ncbi:MAG: DUF2142 domain-containing protein [Verrucomicrobia bacterium]|nr:DUF2142 domain-containing protein [Verrucomicrobiota bacterium]MDA1068895.1 DUF2142 domain-containing protein [Verrucomicrobiota bacterium]